MYDHANTARIEGRNLLKSNVLEENPSNGKTYHKKNKNLCFYIKQVSYDKGVM
jgi:hypothetical protein